MASICFKKVIIEIRSLEKMNLEKIQNAKTKHLGKKIEYFKEIASTHTYAKEKALQENDSGKIILAEAQSNGIGTKGRTWYTGKNKNIAMTIILKPNCQMKQLEGLTKKIAECMKNAIYHLYQIELEIKEPNDLLLHHKKICGILTEVNTISEKINYLLISVGCNINEEKFQKETENIATSLKKEYGKEFSREDIIIKFIENLEKEIDI